MIIKPFTKFNYVGFKNKMFWWNFPQKIKAVLLEKSNLIVPPYQKEAIGYVSNYIIPSNNRIMVNIMKENPVFKTMLDHCDLYVHNRDLSERIPCQIMDIDICKIHFSTLKPIKCIWYIDLD